MELPDKGSDRVDFQCPVCGEGMTLKLVSIERIQAGLLGAFLAITATIFGLGWLLSQAGQKDETLRIAGLVAYGLGGLAFLGTVAFGLVKPDYLAGTGEALKIAEDFVRDRPMDPGFSGMRGHKLFEIRRG
jgi:hypothetical protein